MSDNFIITTNNDNATIALVAILDMAVAEELLNTLRESLALAKNIILNAESVDRISTPCIQIILACAGAVEKKGGRFSLAEASSAFERGMRDLGLLEYYKNWSEI